MMNDEVLLLDHRISAAAGTALLLLKRKIEEAQKEKAKRKGAFGWTSFFRKNISVSFKL